MEARKKVSKVLILGLSGKAKDNREKGGGVFRSISNLVNSNDFKKEFDYDLFDDSNTSKSLLQLFLQTFTIFFSLSYRLKKGNYDLVFLHYMI